jgi:hypothetical protein
MVVATVPVTGQVLVPAEGAYDSIAVPLGDSLHVDGVP